MFDLVTGKARRPPNHATVPILISTTAQALAGAAALAIPALFVAEQIPEIPTMLAFVAPAPSPPAPPPPPAQRPAAVKPVTQPQPVPSTPEVIEVITPVDAPPHATATEATGPPAIEDGVPGGVDGGVPGGIVGGLANGASEPPPPPPPAPATREPVRIGGDIQPPALVHRVEPVYPPAAVVARLQGIVILEALVDRDGLVAEVKVLRSAGSILDREALTAVRQWRYSPLLRNGQRERFVLTVTLSFSVQNQV